MPINYQVTIPMWLQIPQEIRNKIVEIFELKRSSGTVVESLNGKMEVKTDGYTHSDLAEITIEKMNKYLNLKEKNFWTLFDALIEKLENDLKPKEDKK